jgi:hypothetical protein
MEKKVIAPYQSGLVNNLEPWLIPEDAFETLEDAYVWRGRIRKRFGTRYIGSSDLTSQLRLNIGTTAAVTGDFSVTVPGIIFKVGQRFSIGTTIFTVNVTGNPASLLTTGTATGTYDTTTGALIITGNTENPSTIVYFYPSEPVMGLRTRENPVFSAEDFVAFDTQFAYIRSGGAWSRLGSGAAATWTASDSEFPWTINARGAAASDLYFYVVNNNTADNIRYLPEGSTTWVNLRPQLDTAATRFLETSLVLLYFKGRLVALNTKEREGLFTDTYANRARFSRVGDPTNATTSWLDEVDEDGGFIDAPTAQAIVSADFLRDRLIVYFERSTWELVYIGDPSTPFTWNLIDDELGGESTFSIIGFDEVTLCVGARGINACNGIAVKRIDDAIPNFIHSINNDNEGPLRVYGLRNYFMEMAIWSYPDHVGDKTFPNRIILYNYKNRAWGIFKDSVTCFGGYQAVSELTWESLCSSFNICQWSVWTSPWNSSRYQVSFTHTGCGNQHGMVFIMDPDVTLNSSNLIVTDADSSTGFLTVYNHNLDDGDYVLIENAVGVTSLSDIVTRISFVDENTFRVDTPFIGTYSGGGVLKRISNPNIWTKQYNFGTQHSKQFHLPMVDLLLSNTGLGEISYQYFINSNRGSSADQYPPGVQLGTDRIETYPVNSFATASGGIYTWHRIYPQAESPFVQFRFYMDDLQIRNPGIYSSDIQMHALIFHISIGGRITG